MPAGLRRQGAIPDRLPGRIEHGREVLEPVIHVGMDHPRVRAADGVPVFLPQGGQAPYLEHVIQVLRGDGVQPAGLMYAEFERLGLIQPVEFELKSGPTMSGRLTGFHAIDRERLAALPGADLVALHRSGWLEGAYLMLASLHNINRLAARKRARLAPGNWATGLARRHRRQPGLPGIHGQRVVARSAGTPLRITPARSAARTSRPPATPPDAPRASGRYRPSAPRRR